MHIAFNNNNIKRMKGKNIGNDNIERETLFNFINVIEVNVFLVCENQFCTQLNRFNIKWKLQQLQLNSSLQNINWLISYIS